MGELQTSTGLARSFDAGAADYRDVTSTLGNHVYERVARDNLRSCFSGKRFKRVLDAGGGVGKWIPFLADYAERIDLLDISAESVRLAAEALGPGYPQASFACGDLEHMPYGSAGFDLVFAQGCVVSYTPDPRALLAEVARVLRPGGILWVDAYNCLGWALESRNTDWKLLFAGAEKDHVFRMPKWDYPARMFQPPYLVDLVETAGFRIIAEYGSVILVNSLSFDDKGTTDFDAEAGRRLCEQEIRLSRDPRCRGAGKNYCVLAAREVRAADGTRDPEARPRRIGMTREGTLREHRLIKGEWRTSHQYSILEQELGAGAER